MIDASFPAMGTTATVFAATLGDIDRCRQLLAELEFRLSRFLPDSELSALNRDPASVVDVSSTLGAVLAAAQDLRRRTGGLVDPAVGAAVEAWGYDRTFSDVGDGREAPKGIVAGDWQVAGTRLRRQAGTTFDLGGIAKGWAADRAVDREMAFLVSLGGDVRSALPDAVADVLDPEGDVAARVRLGMRGMATSSVTKRRWRTTAGEANHIIDPRTLAPTRSPVLAATAACATGVESEAAAKTVLLLGADGLRWAEEQPWVDAAMVAWHDRSVFATKGWEMAA